MNTIYIYTHTHEQVNDSSRMSQVELIQAELTSFVQPSRIYMRMSHLIYEQIIVFTNSSFIFQTDTESSLSKSSRTEFTRIRAHLTPLVPCFHPLTNTTPIYQRKPSPILI
jgi:hypothetical protein